jgi:hypothetical protein
MSWRSGNLPKVPRGEPSEGSQTHLAKRHPERAKTNRPTVIPKERKRSEATEESSSP